MRNIYLDFETFYDTASYSLSRMPTEAYIRDDRFDATVLTVATDTSDVIAVTGNDIGPLLRGLKLDLPGTDVWAHNARFDASIASYRYGVSFNRTLCTMAAGRWCGPSRLTRESLDAVTTFFRNRGLIHGIKGTMITAMNGKHFSQVSPELQQDFIQYAKDDTANLRDVVRQYLPHLTEDVKDFISMTIKMYSEPVVHLDTGLLTEYVGKLHEQHVAAQNRLLGIFNFSSVEDFMGSIRSAARFSKLLESLGVPTPMKLSEKKTATARKKVLEEDPNADVSEIEVMTPALSKNDLEFRDLADHDDPRVAALVTAKLENNSSIAESRARTFLNVATRGTLPIALEALAAWTGRYAAGTRDESVASDNNNLQNLNKRGGDKTLRRSLLAPEGYSFVAGDSKQVEARMGAYITREHNLLNGFIRGEDVYVDMASTIYHRPVEEIIHFAKGAGSNDPVEGFIATVQRNVGKETILSSQYNISGGAFARRLRQNKILLAPFDQKLEGDEAVEWHNKEAARINRLYRSTYTNIRNFWKVCEDVLLHLTLGNNGWFGGPDNNLFYYDGNHQVYGERVPGIMFPDGYWLLYPGLKYDYDADFGRWGYTFMETAKGKTAKKHIYGGLLFNNLCQGISFAAMRWQAVRINKEVRVILNVHDEWVSMVRDEDIDKAVAIYRHWMKECPPWLQGMPFDCDISVGKNYGDMKELR